MVLEALLYHHLVGRRAADSDRKHPARDRRGGARPAAGWTAGRGGVVRARVVLRLRARDVPTPDRARPNSPAGRPPGRAPASVRPGQAADRRIAGDRAGLSDSDGEVADPVRAALADGAHPGARGHGRGAQAASDTVYRLGRACATPADDLVWLVVAGGAIALAVAFACSPRRSPISIRRRTSTSSRPGRA